MNNKRLLKLAGHLENRPPKLFDMSIFGVQRICGTVVCALGDAGTIPEFRRKGLKLVKCDGYHGFTVELTTETGKRLGDLDAAVAFFDITMQVANILFMPDSPLYCDLVKFTPKRVAKQIRKFVANPERYIDAVTSCSVTSCSI